MHKETIMKMLDLIPDLDGKLMLLTEITLLTIDKEIQDNCEEIREELQALYDKNPPITKIHVLEDII